jgi:hypothetical protein
MRYLVGTILGSSSANSTNGNKAYFIRWSPVRNNAYWMGWLLCEITHTILIGWLLCVIAHTKLMGCLLCVVTHTKWNDHLCVMTHTK